MWATFVLPLLCATLCEDLWCLVLVDLGLADLVGAGVVGSAVWANEELAAKAKPAARRAMRVRFMKRQGWVGWIGRPWIRDRSLPQRGRSQTDDSG